MVHLRIATCYHVTNKVSSLFLYKENTEERDKDGLCKALRKILVEGICDNADALSDELLLKELFAID
jgi:hypothetical protein